MTKKSRVEKYGHIHAQVKELMDENSQIEESETEKFIDQFNNIDPAIGKQIIDSKNSTLTTADLKVESLKRNSKETTVLKDVINKLKTSEMSVDELDMEEKNEESTVDSPSLFKRSSRINSYHQKKSEELKVETTKTPSSSGSTSNNNVKLKLLLGFIALILIIVVAIIIKVTLLK